MGDRDRLENGAVMLIPYVVYEGERSIRLVPFGGGREIRVAAPTGDIVEVSSMSAGRILFQYMPPAGPKPYPPGRWPIYHAVRETNGRVRIVSTVGDGAITRGRPGGGFLIVRNRPLLNSARAFDISPTGRVRVLAERIPGANESPTVVAVPGGWLYSSLKGTPLISLRRGRPPRRLAERSPEAVSLDGRFGAFLKSGVLTVEGLSPSLRGLGRGRVLARVPVGRTLEDVRLTGDLVEIRWADLVDGRYHMLVDLARRRTAAAYLDKFLSLRWFRRGGSFEGIGKEEGRSGGFLRVFLPSRPAKLLRLALPTEPALARSAPFDGQADDLLFAVP